LVLKVEQVEHVYWTDSRYP